MISRQDPDFQETLRWRKTEADRAFREGEITEAVYMGSLFALGFRGGEIIAERNLILMEKQS